MFGPIAPGCTSAIAALSPRHRSPSYTTAAMASESSRTDATQRVTDPHGAEQPALITTLEQCATWMSSVTTHEANEPLRRLSEAVHVLQEQPSRSHRNQIQRMLKSWEVPQKDKSGAKIGASDVEAMLKRKVLDEARRLKTLHDAHGSSSAILLTLGRSP